MTVASPIPVSVVLITWNSAETLPACLDGLASSSPPPAELVVVDNASSDGGLALLEAYAPRARFPVRIVRNATNVGFARAANLGIAAAQAPFVFLLNPDVRLLPETLPELHGSLAIAPPDVAAAGGKLRRAEGAELRPTPFLDSTGIVMTREGRHFDRGSNEVDRGQYDALGEVFGLTGAAVLLRREAAWAARVDGEIFDEDFFAFREDADFAWRLRGFGYRALYDPDAVAYHRRTVFPSRRRRLSGEVNFHSVKNRFLLRIHHADLAWWRANGPRSLLRDVVVLGACLTIEWSSLPAFVWLVRHLAKHLRRRREIMARRRVSGEELLSWFA